MEELELKRLVDLGLSISQLAKETNRTKISIRYWLKKYNLKTRLSAKATEQDHKICFKCNIEKHINDFYKVKDKKGISTYCKKCVATLTVGQNKTFKKLCISYKGDVCQVCGYCKCNNALEFHHLNPLEKDFTISNNPRKTLNNKIREELDKCIILCSNCHREVHAGLLNINEIHMSDNTQRP